MPRILIIGLDGASPHLVQRWRADLPHLARLMEEGASGVLFSVTPPRSIPAWYCFATGMNPAKIGVFGFSQRRPDAYDYTFANFSYCQAPPFWEWLNRFDIPTGVIHVPGTFPPRPVEGFLLSGWPAPLDRGNLIYTYPADISREIEGFLGAPFEFLSPAPIHKDNDREALRERLRILQMHGDVADHLLSTRPWQVALVVLSPLDRASHQFWRHLDPDHPQHEPDQDPELVDALRTVYRASDAQVGRLLAHTGAEDTIFIVSDHGFGPNHRIFYVNEWLRQHGYLKLKQELEPESVGVKTRLLGSLSEPIFRLNDASPTFRRIIEPLKKRALSNYLRDEYVRSREEGMVRLNHLPVDWRRTRVYCPDESSIYLNLRGRDPEGIVSPGREAEQLLDELEAGLREIPDPETGAPIPVRLDRKETIYSGPYLEAAPDLIMAMDDYRTEVMAELGAGRLFDLSPDRNGTHTPEGLLIARGPGIIPGKRLDAGLMDIAPTVLHLARTPIPAQSDGRVLLELFSTDSEAKTRATVFAASDLGQDDGEVLSDEEQAQVEEQLRNLGYLA